MHPSQEESQDVQDLELLKQQAEKILYWSLCVTNICKGTILRRTYWNTLESDASPLGQLPQCSDATTMQLCFVTLFQIGHHGNGSMATGQIAWSRRIVPGDHWRRWHIQTISITWWESRLDGLQIAAECSWVQLSADWFFAGLRQHCDAKVGGFCCVTISSIILSDTTVTHC